MANMRILVDEVDSAIEFYAALGFEITERWGPPFAIVSRGDVALWLSGPGTSARKSLSDGTTPQPGGWNRIVLEVASLEETMKTLRERGAKFRGDPISGPGGTQVVIDDPSGNPVELFEPHG